MRNKFKCEKCDRLYFYKSSLKKHLVAHEKEKKRNEKLEEITEQPQIVLATINPQNIQPPMISKNQIVIANNHTNKEPAKEYISQIANTNNLMLDYKMNCLINNPNIQQFKEANFFKSQQHYMQLGINDIFSFPRENGIEFLLSYNFDLNLIVGYSNYAEQSYCDDFAKLEDNMFEEDKRMMSFGNGIGKLFYHNKSSSDQQKSPSEAMSEIDPREYKLMKAMRSKDLVFIDSDDEEDPVKQVKSAPVTYRTETIAVQHEIRMSSAAPPLYNMENLFALESNNYLKEREYDSLFIIEEKPQTEYLETDYYNNF